MELKEIKALLQKYYEGLSTPEEESILDKYFQGDQIPVEMEADKTAFNYYHDVKEFEENNPVDLSDSIRNMIQNEDIRVKTNRRRLIYSVSGIAAALIVLFGSVVFLLNQSNYIIINGEKVSALENPKLAITETQKAMEMLGKYFNNGFNEVQKIEKITTAPMPLNNLKKIDKSLNKLNYLQRMYEGIESLNVFSKFNESQELITNKN